MAFRTFMIAGLSFTLVSALLASGCCGDQTGMPDDLALPESTTGHDPNEAGLAVFISRSEIRVGTEVVAKYESLGPDGFDPSLKGGDENGFLIHRMRELVVDHRSRADGQTREAILYVDRSTPYRAFTEVLYTLGQSDVVQWHVVVVRDEQRAAKRFEAPSVDNVGGPALAQGIRVAVGTKNIVLRGADGPCVAVKRDEGYDFPRLKSCATAAAKKDGGENSWAYVGADPGIDFQTIIRVVDAVFDSYPSVAFTVSP